MASCCRTAPSRRSIFLDIYKPPRVVLTSGGDIVGQCDDGPAPTTNGFLLREALPPACAESTTEATALANSRTAPALTRFCWLPASLLRSMCREPPQHSAVASISGAMSQGTSGTPSPTLPEGSSPQTVTQE